MPQAVTAAIKTLAETDINWEEVTGLLFEESLGLVSEDGRRDQDSQKSTVRTDHTNSACAICDKTNQKTRDCFLNDLNSNNKLGLSAEDTEKIHGLRRSNGSQKRRSKRRSGRAGLSRVMTARVHKNVDRLMMDIMCTSHMTPMKERGMSPHYHFG